MTSDQVFILLQQAIHKFYNHDAAYAPERNCVARIAGYMQCMLEHDIGNDNLSVDCEYAKVTANENNEYVKQLDSYGVFGGLPIKHSRGCIYPDIIVHERGTHANNLLVVEFKGYWNRSKWDKDEAKLKAFTKECPHVNIKKYFNYQRGVFVALGRNKAHLVEFMNGEQVSQNQSVNQLQHQRGEL